MRALRFHGARDLRLESLPDPPAPVSDEVLVSPLVCGICGTDLHEYAGGPIYPSAAPHPLTGATMPQILGHEFSAEVIAIGPDVRSVVPGSRVAVKPMIRCGRCRWCVRGDYELCETYACTGLTSPWGGFSTRAMVREYQALALPASVSNSEGALLEPAAVAMTAIRRANVRAGDAVLVTGGGPIGGFAAMLAALAGAGSVIIVEPNPTRRALLEERSIGDLRLDPLASDVGAIARQRTGGYGVDVAIECSGQARALNDAVDATHHGGTIVQVGLFSGEATINPFVWCNKNLRVEAMVNHHPSVWGALIDLIANQRIDLGRVVTSRSDLAAATDGFERLLDQNGEDIKILVDIDTSAGVSSG